MQGNKRSDPLITISRARKHYDGAGPDGTLWYAYNGIPKRG